MKFDQPLLPGRLLRRYKRFLADVRLASGEVVTCHCPNTGSMMGCAEPGMPVWLSESDNPRRKYRHTWEIVEAAPGTLVGVHTGRTNALAREAVEAGLVAGLAGYTTIRPEVRVPEAPMRADYHLDGHPQEPACYLEVKNVTAAVAGGVALFPDAVSERGTRHLRVLTDLAGHGLRAALLFVAQRGDVREVRPADTIDPAYGLALRAAIAAGVSVTAVRARATPEAIVVERLLPVVCPELGNAQARII